MRPDAGRAVVSRPRVVDAALVILAVAITAVSTPGPTYATAGPVVAALFLFVRRVRPALVTTITMGADLAVMGVLVEGDAPLLVGAGTTIALYSLGRHG
ncbi:MAG: hypothetical protein HOW59_29835, partial [Nonomuraea sp.]|nr:hypothetical protein [Nonomuraea sp.]